jgi:hypothetical protein
MALLVAVVVASSTGASVAAVTSSPAPQAIQILNEPAPPHPVVLREPQDAATPDPTHTPAPPRKVQVTRSVVRPPSSAATFLACVAHHESRGDYRAENPTSTASGKYQWLDSSWQAYARKSGIGTRYTHAASAPPAVQDALTLWVVLHGGWSNWKGTHCGHGT